MTQVTIAAAGLNEEKATLLPCPFCGSPKQALIFKPGKYGYSPQKAYIQCLGCKCTSTVFSDLHQEYTPREIRLKAVNAWNRRN